MKTSFKTAALIGKYKSPEIAAPLLELAGFLEKRGVKVLLDRLTASHIGDCPYPVLRLEELGGAHISCIGVGPGRDQTIVRRDILAAR